MSKLYYRYGTMNAGKSLSLLTVNHNYLEQGKKPLILKPSLDSRSSAGRVESRIGISAKCDDISTDLNLYLYIKYYLKYIDVIDCILVDEAQFLSAEQVKQLSRITIDFKIPVICYGLKNTYKENELFAGSAALLFAADKIEEIKTVCECRGCTRKATHNLKLENNIPVYHGDTVCIGDVKDEDAEYKYLSVCREHYLNPIL